MHSILHWTNRSRVKRVLLSLKLPLLLVPLQPPMLTILVILPYCCSVAAATQAAPTSLCYLHGCNCSREHTGPRTVPVLLHDSFVSSAPWRAPWLFTKGSFSPLSYPASVTLFSHNYILTPPLHLHSFFPPSLLHSPLFPILPKGPRSGGAAFESSATLHTEVVTVVPNLNAQRGSLDMWQRSTSQTIFGMPVCAVKFLESCVMQ